MKKKKAEDSIRAGCGINITDSISLTFNNKYRINSRILLILTTIAGITGFTLSFLSLFEFECSRKMLFASETAVFILSAFFCMFPSKARNLNFLIYIAWGYGIYKKITDFALGYGIFVNIISEKIKVKTGTVYEIPADTDKYLCLTVFLVFLFTLLIPIICYNTIVKPRFIVIFLVTFPFIETGLMFGFSPHHIAFALLISYWVAVFAMRIAGNQYHTESGKPVFVRKKNIFVSSGNLRNNVIEDIGIITLLSVFSFFLVTAGIINAFGISRPEQINDKRKELKANSVFSVEKLISDIINPDTAIPPEEKSRLGDLPEISYMNKTDLIMTITEKPEGMLYLKGFVGTEYRNNSWYALSKETEKEYKDLFADFKSTGSYPQYFNFANDSFIAGLRPEKISKYSITVNSRLLLNPYAYTPYSISRESDLVPELDRHFTVKNKSNNYSYDAYLPHDMFLSTGLIADHLYDLPTMRDLSDAENAYRDFVYKNYTILPDIPEIGMLKDEYTYIPEYNGYNVNDIYIAIRRLLRENAVYTLEPGYTPQDSEITYYLLKESHKGFCSHFATAAVVLARMKGIPARYAEGYIVAPSDFAGAEKLESGRYKLDVKDSRAHAWAEFYIDGYGWLPFEFTPGYDLGIIAAENEANKKTQPEVTEAPETEPAPVETVTEAVTEAAAETVIVTVPVPAVPETEAVTADASSASPSSPDDNTRGTVPTVLEALLKVLIAVLALIIAVVAVIIAKHVYVVGKRARSFRTDSNSESMKNLYRYALDLLEHISITRGNMLPLEFAVYADEQTEGLTEKGSMTELVKLALKAGFSRDDLTDDELDFARKTVTSLADSIYAGKTRKEKIAFRFIKNLHG